jgi:hypothetical protein
MTIQELEAQVAILVRLSALEAHVGGLLGTVARLEGQRAALEAAQREQGERLKAEIDVLRGVDCCADGDGPCGVCVKCAATGRHVAKQPAPPAPAQQAACDERCVGRGTAEGFGCGDLPPHSKTKCDDDSWRCDGTGPAHRGMARYKCEHCEGDSPDPMTAAKERIAIGAPPKGTCCEWSKRPEGSPVYSCCVCGAHITPWPDGHRSDGPCYTPGPAGGGK